MKLWKETTTMNPEDMKAKANAAASSAKNEMHKMAGGAQMAKGFLNRIPTEKWALIGAVATGLLLGGYALNSYWRNNPTGVMLDDEDAKKKRETIFSR